MDPPGPSKKFEISAIFRERKSRFIKPFLKVRRGILCCPFYEVAYANGCPYSCSYCYLRGTAGQFGRSWIGVDGKPEIFTNTTTMYDEVDAFLRTSNEMRPTVLHTGELADSLAFEESPKMLAPIIEMFARQRHHKLLLLTKSSNVSQILDLHHAGQTVVGFSVNPPEIAEEFEHLAASVKDRLKAAASCIDAGYPVVFRLDPMIPVNGWRDTYGEFLKEIDGWPLLGMALGTIRAYSNLLRFLPKKLRKMLTTREFDRRHRLPETLRIEMYEFAMSNLSYTRIGICKESGAIFGYLAAKLKKKFLCNCLL